MIESADFQVKDIFNGRFHCYDSHALWWVTGGVFPCYWINTKAGIRDQGLALSLKQDISGMCCSSQQQQRVHSSKASILQKILIGAVKNGVVQSHQCHTSIQKQWILYCNCQSICYWGTIRLVLTCIQIQYQPSASLTNVTGSNIQYQVP